MGVFSGLHGRVLAILAGTAFGVVALDQVTKAWAVASMQPRIAAGEGPIYLLGPLLRLTYTENSGAAFGFGAGYTWVFTLVAVVVGVVIVRFARTITSRAWALALGGLLGGLLGNLIDRLTRPPSPGMGSVVDFIGLPNFPIFNVADMSITFSAIAMVVLAWRGVPLSDEASESIDESSTEKASTENASTDDGDPSSSSVRGSA